MRCLPYVGASLLMCLAAPALSGPTNDITVFALERVGDHFVIKVPYADLDLNRPDQVMVLRSRVGAAVRQGCATKLYDPPLTENEQRGCIDIATGGTTMQLRRAEQRAREVATTGHSDLPMVAIAVSAGF